MKKNISLFFIILLSWSLCLEGKMLDVSVNAQSAILMNAKTGQILYEKKPHEQHYPASITKIATAIYALKVRGNKLDKMIAAEQDCIVSISSQEKERSNYTLPPHWLEKDTQHIGIKRGEELSLYDLLQGVLIPSGGDASNVVAQYIGGSVPTFMSLVNEYLQELGCKNTYFNNPHGLHHPKHLTTAYDMALLTKDALQNETFCQIVNSTRFQRPETNKQKTVTLAQGNQLLRRGKYYYSKAIGVKTGYHSKAKHTLVSAAKDGERTLIAVLLKNDNRGEMFVDAKKLFEAAFREKKVRRKLLLAGPQKVALTVPSASKNIRTILQKDLVLDYYPSEAPSVKCFLDWKEVTLPLKKGDLVGVVHVKDAGGLVLVSEPLFSESDVDYNLIYRFKNVFTAKLLFGVILTLIFLVVLVGFIATSRR